ncbi:CAPZB, partial [Cordylochernes scorpioides]
ERYLETVISLCVPQVPALCEDLLSSVDQPLKIARDKMVGKDYLLCDYNRDGDSYRSVSIKVGRLGHNWPYVWPFHFYRKMSCPRSPWSNTYDPPLEDGAMPSERIRKLEQDANQAFDQYREMYFEGGVSSVYLWDLDHGFAGAILIKKAGDGSKKIKGCWDSIHVIEVQSYCLNPNIAAKRYNGVNLRGYSETCTVQEKSSGRSAHYKLTSTAMLWLQTNKPGSGTMNLGGSLTRQVESDHPVGESSPHIANIGRMVE